MLYIICIVIMMIMVGGVAIVNCCCYSLLRYSRWAAIAIAGGDEGFV